MTLQQHLEPGGTKRILALDGGGIRGALTLGYLQRIEDVLKEQSDNKENFRLSDYFDLIGGTSTGAIIASCLAIGMKVSQITDLYMKLGGKNIFQKAVLVLQKSGMTKAFRSGVNAQSIAF